MAWSAIEDEGGLIFLYFLFLDGFALEGIHNGRVRYQGRMTSEKLALGTDDSITSVANQPENSAGG